MLDYFCFKLPVKTRVRENLLSLLELHSICWRPRCLERQRRRKLQRKWIRLPLIWLNGNVNSLFFLCCLFIAFCGRLMQLFPESYSFTLWLWLCFCLSLSPRKHSHNVVCLHWFSISFSCILQWNAWFPWNMQENNWHAKTTYCTVKMDECTVSIRSTKNTI